MVSLILATLLAVSVLNAFFAVRRARLRIERELDQVAETLADASFPLTDSVLQKMQGLSGAEFVLMERTRVAASSSSVWNRVEIGSMPRRSAPATSGLDQPIDLYGKRYFHTAIPLRRVDAANAAMLHILYPEETYREAWRDAVYPPLLVGAVALGLAFVLAAGIAARVTRPLGQLQRQVGRIADGTFHPMNIPSRNDELADLSRSINRMAQMLTEYESDVRKHERLRTLGQLGAGLAHQLRNAVTGCRMAIELHRRACGELEDGGSLQVAQQQLRLMENHLQRFLSLGKQSPRARRDVSYAGIVDSAIHLVSQTAQHVGVAIEWAEPDEAIRVHGDSEALQQMIVNLVLNGIEAASQERCHRIGMTAAESVAAPKRLAAPEHGVRPPPRVSLQLQQTNGHVTLTVRDTGDGPSAGVAEKLFEPFVTGKPEGTGLGLWVARDIVSAHGGQIDWHRDQEMTCFVIKLPRAVAGVTSAVQV
jgi:signal transduction histidine kinase